METGAKEQRQMHLQMPRNDLLIRVDLAMSNNLCQNRPRYVQSTSEEKRALVAKYEQQKHEDKYSRLQIKICYAMFGQEKE